MTLLTSRRLTHRVRAGRDVPPPTVWEATAPSPNPMNDAAAKLATHQQCIIFLTIVIIVLPRHPEHRLR